MGRIKTIARRTFLVGSVAVAGGVAFGTYLVKKTPDNPLLDGLKDGEAALTPWVKIDSEKVTLIGPHADKGQGVASLQAALIAEELDIDLDQFETSFGVPSAAYWNTAMGEEAVPFMSTDHSTGAETMRSVMSGLFKVMGMQGTGGSTAAADSFVKLRQAGASARETLKMAASEKSGVAIDELKTARGAVQLPDGTELKYTELADIAAKIDPVQDVELRDPSTWRFIGKPMQRVDIVRKSTGTQDYGIDISVDGMVHAAVKVNPRQGGKLESYDAAVAEKMRGVKKIVPVTNGVAVLADNTWRAFQAADAIEFEWGAAPYPAEQADHWKAVEASFAEDKLDSEWRNEGDINQALKDATVVEAEYRSPYVAHQPLEPLNAIVRINDDSVDIWTGHQIPRLLQEIVAGMTGMEQEQIHLHNQFIGGSFGHRLEFENIRLATEIAKQMPGTPVKLTYKREEDFAHDFPRHISIGRGKGTTKDGKVEAIDLEIAAPSVVGSQMPRAGLNIPGPDAQIVAGGWNNPYNLPNFRMRAYRTPELAPVSSWRSVGAVGAGFHFDCFLDEMIHAAGADPMAERIRLMNDENSRKVLEAVAEMSNWGADLGKGKGQGVAFVESFGVPTAQVVEVSETEDGIKLDKVFIAADVGRVLDPINFDNLVKGGVVFGLGHAMNCEITYSDGMAEQSNFDSHEGMRFSQCPEIHVKGLENNAAVRGIGEPPVPPGPPALANAIFAATGKRIREMPFSKHIDFA